MGFDETCHWLKRLILLAQIFWNKREMLLPQIIYFNGGRYNGTCHYLIFLILVAQNYTIIIISICIKYAIITFLKMCGFKNAILKKFLMIKISIRVIDVVYMQKFVFLLLRFSDSGNMNVNEHKVATMC